MKCSMLAILLFGSLGLISGCSITKNQSSLLPSVQFFESEPEELRIDIRASSDLNPDINGRSSPVIFRYYQLSNDGLFNANDVVQLYKNDLSALNADLIDKKEHMIQPGDTITGSVTQINFKTRYIGLLAVFQALNRANAKVLVKVDPEQPLSLCVFLQNNKITYQTTGCD